MKSVCTRVNPPPGCNYGDTTHHCAVICCRAAFFQLAIKQGDITYRKPLMAVALQLAISGRQERFTEASPKNGLVLLQAG